MARADTISPFATGGFDTASLNQLNEGIIVTDGRGNVNFLNQKAEKLIGNTAAEGRGQPLAEFFQLFIAQDGKSADDALELALAAEGSSRLYTDHALEGPNSTLRPIVWSIGQLRDVDNNVSGIVVVFRDPNEMSLTPEELIRANRFD
jgi:PAS domain S-box-containing protein